MISIFKNKESQHAVTLTRDLFLQLIDCKEIDEMEKEARPGVCWQSWWPEGHRRKQEMAVQSGLFILDVDHIEDVDKWIAERRDELMGNRRIRIVHVSASGHGIRIVADRREETIFEDQLWLSAVLRTPFDPSCGDGSRLSFLVGRDKFVKIDLSVFDADFSNPYMGKPYTFAEKKQTFHKPSGKVGGKRGPQPWKGEGVNEDRVRKMVGEWIAWNGGEPPVGERNNRLFRLACVLAEVYGGNDGKVAEFLPSFGLDEAEVRRVAYSACLYSEHHLSAQWREWVDSLHAEAERKKKEEPSELDLLLLDMPIEEEITNYELDKLLLEL